MYYYTAYYHLVLLLLLNLWVQVTAISRSMELLPELEEATINGYAAHVFISSNTGRSSPVSILLSVER